MAGGGERMIDVACPGCGKRLEMPASRAGREGRCPGCGASIAVPPSAAMPSTETPELDLLPDGRPRPGAAPSPRPRIGGGASSAETTDADVTTDVDATTDPEETIDPEPNAPDDTTDVDATTDPEETIDPASAGPDDTTDVDASADPDETLDVDASADPDAGSPGRTARVTPPVGREAPPAPGGAGRLFGWLRRAFGGGR